MNPMLAPLNTRIAPFGAFLLKLVLLFYIVWSEIKGSGELSDCRITKKENIEMQKNNEQEALKRQTMGQGMAIGMVLFIPFGIIFSILIGNFAWIGWGLPLGVSVGVAIGESLYQRKMGQ
jgi:hypothetical protein